MLHYQIEFDDYRQHLIHVTLRFVADPTQVLSLPTWIPGSYLIREFSKHIESVRAYDEEGRLLEIQKFEKNKWRLFNTDHELITVEYDVYAYDLSVRGAYVDQTRLYVNPACACLGLEGQEDKAVEVELFLPDELKHFQLGLRSSSSAITSPICKPQSPKCTSPITFLPVALAILLRDSPMIAERRCPICKGFAIFGPP